MKFVYPALFHEEPDGTWAGGCPDLEGCTAAGETLEDAVDNCNEALRNWITAEMEEDDWYLPAATDPSELACAPGEAERNIAVNIRFFEGWDE